MSAPQQRGDSKHDDGRRWPALVAGRPRRGPARARLGALVLLLLAAAAPLPAQSTGTVVGRLLDVAGLPVAGATVTLGAGTTSAITGPDGRFRLSAIPPGTHPFTVDVAGYVPQSVEVTVAQGVATELSIRLTRLVVLEGLTAEGTARPGSVSYAPEVLRGMVLAGTGNTIIQLRGAATNLAEKSGRQIFARVPGAFVYDMDGSGNQVNLSTRGLDPHRSWELNVRQDGVLLNSDLYGYPASHYSPPRRRSAGSTWCAVPPPSSTAPSTAGW